jgi:hypothetical protein
MKCLKTIAVLAILLATISALQTNFANAASTSIINAIPLDSWGNDNVLVYRGHTAAINITLNSTGESTPVRVFITLMDCNNVAVGVANASTVVVGQTSLTLNYLVAPYAFVGAARYTIIVTDVNLQPITAYTVPINISILGDFDFNGKVDFQDILRFVDAFSYYNQYHVIPSSKKIVDINGDNKVDFNDLLIFSGAFADYNNVGL